MKNGITINGREYELVDGSIGVNDCVYDCDLFNQCMNYSLCVKIFNEPSKHFKLKEMQKNSITINGKEYVPVITKGAKNYLDDCACCDLRVICEKNKDIYCFLNAFNTIFKNSKAPRHFELLQETGGIR